MHPILKYNAVAIEIVIGKTSSGRSGEEDIIFGVFGLRIATGRDGKQRDK